jgi:hypothetical protein
MAARGKDVGPTRRFAASPGVGPGATVGTLRTGYPRVQASSQDNGSRPRLRAAPRLLHVPTARAPTPGSGQLRGCHVSPWLGLPLPARSSSGAATCPHVSGSRSRLGAAPGPSCAPMAWANSGAVMCYLGPGAHLLTQGQLRSCHVSPGLSGLQANEQISFGGLVIMISIGAGAPMSSKALCDKGCSALSQGV